MNYKCNTENFILKSKSKYGDNAFDYSLVDYINGYTNVKLICNKHGEFEITPSKHFELVGGCPICSKEQRKKRTLMTTDDYKKLVQEKYGDKYDLSTVEYNGMKNYVTVICHIHGEFTINAYDFINKRGCPKCARENKKKTIKKETTNKSKLTLEEFINVSNKIFDNFYDYSKTNLNERDEKGRVCIICPKHGEFWQNPYSHMKGHKCTKCGRESMASTQSLTTELFIKKAKEIHGDKYDYSLVTYKGCYEEVEIICPIHGSFMQQASVHLNGHGCKQCANEKNIKILTSNTQDFIKKAELIHGKENDYSFVDYKGAKIPVTIICKNGHKFSQMPNKHLEGHSCPYCSNNISRPEKEIVEFLTSNNINAETNQRQYLSSNKELDIVIPSKNVAIEYNGLYWHNETKHDKNYHLNKTIECFDNNIRLIHIFEDEWIYKKEIVKSRLNTILGNIPNKIYARKCEIREIDNNTCKEFLDNNHIQGGINAPIRYGLFYNNELVSVMNFCKLRKNLGQNSNENEYELLRFCNKLDTIVVGGASKLFKHFIKMINPTIVKSYADRRWNTGNLYEKLGFEFTHFSQPNYFYVIGQQRHNRFSFRKDILVEQGFDSNKSEHEIMFDRGIYRIYDCGCLCYKWTSKN